METSLTPRLPYETTSQSIVVLEDQALIAIDLEAMLRQLGFSNITLVASSEQALTMIDKCDLAILDVSLRRGTSAQVAEQLLARGVPFIFSTGHFDTGLIPIGLKHLPILRKPYSIESLEKALVDLLKSTSPRP